MSLQIPTSGLKEPTLRGARHHSAIYHIEAEKEQAEALKVQPVKVEAPVVQDYYKFYRKGIERVEKKTNQNENQLEPGTIHIRNVFSEKGTEADYSETDFSPTRLSTITKTNSKSSADLTAISELTKKYFDCQKILVDVDDSLAHENATKVSKLLQQRVHESFMKEFWALQYHYPKGRFKRVGDGIKKPPPSVNDFEPTLEMITARRKRTTVLAVPKHVETPVVKLPAVVEPIRRKKPVSPRKSLKSAKSIYNLLPQSENGIIDVKAMSKLTTSVNLNDKPFVGSAGKRALIPMIGLQRASVWYSEKSHKAQNAEVSTPKSRERSRKEIDADLHQEFQNQARNRMRIITNSVYQRELFSELPKCIRNHLDDVIAILKKPPHERKKIDIAMLKVYVKPLK
ncbi:hypothetical protein HDU79_011556 [Rhizoclosmatium sp. JEL0117]|nr:hypothetical protein HDU79_011556 [Rhizoclosmatium sp. JEL0117]